MPATCGATDSRRRFDCPSAPKTRRRNGTDRTVPDQDTLWASGYEVYDRLSKSMQKLLEQHTANYSAPCKISESKNRTKRKGLTGFSRARTSLQQDCPKLQTKALRKAARPPRQRGHRPERRPPDRPHEPGDGLEEHLRDRRIRTYPKTSSAIPSPRGDSERERLTKPRAAELDQRPDPARERDAPAVADGHRAPQPRPAVPLPVERPQRHG